MMTCNPRIGWRTGFAAAILLMIAASRPASVPAGEVLISVDEESINVPDRRKKMHDEIDAVTREFESKIKGTRDLYTADGRINEKHPGYLDYQKQIKGIKERHNVNDNRYKDFFDACHKVGVGKEMGNTGSKPKTINSDCDFTELKPGAGRKVIDTLQGRGMKVVDMPDRWVIPQWDTTVWKQPKNEVPGTTGHRAQERANAAAEDIFSTQGGKFRTSNGKVGVKDAVGEVLANAKKFSEAVRPRDPATASTHRPDLPDPKLQKVDGHVAGKSVSKVVEWGHVNVDPKFAEQAKALRNHKTWEEAGVVRHGDPPEVKAAKVRDWLVKAESHLGEAMKSAQTKSSDLAAKRGKLVDTFLKNGMKQAAAETIRNQVRANISNEETLRALGKADPKLAGELSGMKLNANPDGTFTDKATGKKMTASEVHEAVTRKAHEMNVESMQKATKGGPQQPPGSKIMNIGGKIIILDGAFHGAMKGAEKAVGEEKPGDSSVWTWGKATVYGTIYATGIPGAIEQGTEAGRQSAEQFRKDLLAGKNPSQTWATIRGALWGIGGFVKGMTVDPLVNGATMVKEGLGAAKDVPSAAWSERQSKKWLQDVRDTKEQKAREKEGAEPRQQRIILAENWVRMRGIPLLPGGAATDNEGLKKSNPNEYNHRIAVVLEEYDRLAEKLRRDGAVGPNKDSARKEIFNLLWHKYRGDAKDFQQAMANQYSTYGKTYVLTPTPQELAGKWGGGRFGVKSTAFAAGAEKMGCTPQVQQEFDKLRGASMPMDMAMQANADGTGVMQLNVTPPASVDKNLAATAAAQKVPAIPFTYRDGKLVGQVQQQGGTFKVEGEMVRTQSGWAFQGSWQMSLAAEGKTVMLMKGDLSSAK